MCIRDRDCGMAIDATHACSESTSGVNTLALVLSVVFSLYIFADSALTSYVIAKKSRDRAELAT